MYEEQYHSKEDDFDEYMYLNEEEDLFEEECELGYQEDYNDDSDTGEYEDEEEEWYKISDRKFAPDPVQNLDISPLIWDTPPNPAEIGSGPLRLERLLVQGVGRQSHCGSDLRSLRHPGDRGRPTAI